MNSQKPSPKQIEHTKSNKKNEENYLGEENRRDREAREKKKEFVIDRFVGDSSERPREKREGLSGERLVKYLWSINKGY